MTYFPGNIMVIDDKYGLVHQPEPADLNTKTIGAG